MSPMQGGRIAAGLLIVMAVISLSTGRIDSAQREAATSNPRRSAPSQPTSRFALVTIILAAAPVEPVIAEARAGGLAPLQVFSRAAAQWLHITTAQTRLLQTVTQPPYNAAVVGRSLWRQNSITILINIQSLRALEALPGVLSVQADPVIPEDQGVSPGVPLPPRLTPTFD